MEQIWVIPILIVLSLVAGALVMHLFLTFRSNTFVKGMEAGEHRMRMVMGIPESEGQEEEQKQAASKLSAKIRTPSSLMFERYELLFDLDVAGYLSSGVVAANWIPLVGRIKDLVEQKFDEFPPDTNTVIVRTIRVHKNGQGEFILEPLHNSELDVKEQSGDKHAG